ncbi:NUDIX hydrolase [Aureimonas sp. SK2]|uniref:NUDIX hydrolase n=1 Tax=Aureimonas sp. SK2 TaxID=3015992 RepID=UPI0024448849|nr:NUDIX hydrolase [Aureimonas sp. SK2]
MSGAAPRVRIRDAASLVLFDRSGGRTRFLMGVRASGHLFMPGHLVFPGGRLEASDVALARHLPLDAAVTERLMRGSPKLASRRRAAALALAAIRETQEETGLLFAERGASPPLPDAFAPFARAGAVPCPRALVPLARAVTPPGMPRRFDARFFLAPADCLLERPDPIAPPSDEFETVIWVGSEELKAFRVADITRLILEAAFARIDEGSHGDVSAPIPFFRRRGLTHTVEHL